MVARSELILRWSVYGGAGLLVCLVQGLILQRLDLWGVMPFLYPALAAMVAVWEGAVPRGAVYALCAFLPQGHFLTYPPVKVAVGVALALTAFGGRQRLLRLRLSIRAERIWLWFTVRCLVWLRGLLLPMW